MWNARLYHFDLGDKVVAALPCCFGAVSCSKLLRSHTHTWEIRKKKTGTIDHFYCIIGFGYQGI